MSFGLRSMGGLCVIDMPPDTFINDKTEALIDVLGNMINKGAQTIILNFDKIKVIDATTFATLLNIQKIAFYSDINIRLFAMDGHMQKVFYQMGFNKFVDVHEESMLIA